MAEIFYLISVWALPALLAITLHEAAHGWVASKLGDDTALRLGRVSFNPFRHIDPFGTILLPGLMLLMGAPFVFGWAKPVPVDFWRLRNPRRDMVLVAAAGPGINLLMALVAALGFHLLPMIPDTVGEWLGDNLQRALLLNVVLALFNLIPLPPLDGGRIAVGLLPDVLAVPLARLERYGMFILIGVLFLLPLVLSQLGIRFSPFQWLLATPVEATIHAILSLAGLTD